MAIQILSKTGLGERLGTAVGTGLTAGLQGLLQSKLNDIERQKGMQQTQSGLQSLGLNPSVAALPESLQQLVVKQALQQPSQQAYANALSSLLGSENPTSQESNFNLSPQSLAGLTQQQSNELARLGLQQRKAENQAKQFETKEARIEQHAINKETKPYYEEITNAGKAAKDNNQRLNRMQQLLNNGNLQSPILYSLSRKIGLDIPGLTSADTQEFNKLSKDFLRSAKAIFGSRLTNFDVNAFLQTVPELSQSDEGKQRIINNMKIFNEGALLRQQALNDIVRENGGKRPPNISELVEERVAGDLDKLSTMFTEGSGLGKPSNNKSELPVLSVENNFNTPPSSETPQNNSSLGNIARTIGGSVARGAESILGIPGDIASTILGGANYLSGNRIPGAEGALKYIPSSGNLRELTKYATGKTLEPQNSGEQFVQDLASDFATFALPVKGKLPIKSAAIKSLLGNAASFLTKSLGGGSLGSTGAKVGTVLAYNLAGGRKALDSVMKQSYEQAENLAGAAKENAKDLSNSINTLTKNLKTGIKTPGKAFVLDHVKGIDKAIKGGKIAVKDAWNLKREVNELIRDKETPQTAQKFLGKIRESLNKVLSTYGKTNTQFGDAFHKAEDIYRGLNQASDISKNIQKAVGSDFVKNPNVKALLYGAIFKSPGLLPAATAGLGAGLGIQSAIKGIELLKNSSEARKYYKNILLAAAREDASLIQKNVKKLDNLANGE